MNDIKTYKTLRLSWLVTIPLFFFCIPTLAADGFELSSASPVDLSAQSLKSADFNGDGNLDILLLTNKRVKRNSNRSDYYLQAQLLSGQGDGSFAVQRLDTLYSNRIMSEAEIADLDNDGDIDLVLAFTGSHVGCIVLANDGAGNFSEELANVTSGDYSDDYVMAQIAVADADTDGDLDIFLASTSIEDLKLIINDGTGKFSEERLISNVSVFERSNSTDFLDFTVADLDGKPGLDFIVAKSGQVTDIRVYFFNGLEYSQPYDWTSFYSGLGTSYITGAQQLRVQDLTSDGINDLVVSTKYCGIASTQFFEQSPENAFFDFVGEYTYSRDHFDKVKHIHDCKTTYNGGDIVDFNGDGILDYWRVWGTVEDGGVAFVMLNSPNGIFAETPQVVKLDYLPGSMASGDFNRDGRPDLAISTRANPNGPEEPNFLRVYLNVLDRTRVEGSLFLADQANCEPLWNSPRFSQKVIQFEPGGWLAITNADGVYSRRLPIGDYEVEPAVDPLWTAACGKDQLNISIVRDRQFLSDNDLPREAKVFVRSLEVSVGSSRFRPGREGQYIIEYENTGTVPYSGLLHFRYDERLEIVKYSMTPIDESSGLTSWMLQDLPVAARGQILIDVSVAENAERGTELCAQAEAAFRRSDVLAGDNIDEICIEVTGSYDPNDIRVWPRGQGESGIISREVKTLSYMVRFQNTGNDTAFTVIVRDTLPEELNLRYLRFGASSHAYTVDLLKNNILEFTFDNILLPDSTTDLLGSQGFVKFRVDLQADLPAGTQIRNRVGIYFDFNEVVLTNTALTTIAEAITSVDSQLQFSSELLSIFPNPAAEVLTISGIDPAAISLELLDILGRRILSLELAHQTRAELNVAGLQAGSYFVQVRGGIQNASGTDSGLQVGRFEVVE